MVKRLEGLLIKSDDTDEMPFCVTESFKNYLWRDMGKDRISGPLPLI